ncbi:MAG: acetyl-CoA carboxylase biotin carboxyl carrier protein [Gammaproteobacteria bacterium]|nr:acetyl-CoA carboxylase biotin carboxyl carrier protein [Gammaproteobacteria bacterium]
MDIRKVKKLIELLEESGIAEIEIHEGEESVRVSRHGSAAHAVVQAAPGGPSVAPAGPETQARAAATAAREELPEGHVIRAPMVGIFYESPAPGRAPFVELGKSVRAGDVLCVIEAMKIMNQIEADVAGTVSRILVRNGEPVEYGQPLFIIREA